MDHAELSGAVLLLASAHLFRMDVISEMHQKQVKTSISFHLLSGSVCFPPCFWASTQQNQRKIHFLAQHKIQHTGKKGTEMFIDAFFLSYCAHHYCDTGAVQSYPDFFCEEAQSILTSQVIL